ncbi:hypothetical protein GCM10009801_15860 [Streptomyces albiaxialis]|uniref:Lipoprotein n=1 Tax=Streptomyces albiaxialis TaxID=329523 RepID=A0ABP5H7W3_9ACTN
MSYRTRGLAALGVALSAASALTGCDTGQLTAGDGRGAAPSPNRPPAPASLASPSVPPHAGAPAPPHAAPSLGTPGHADPEAPADPGAPAPVVLEAPRPADEDAAPRRVESPAREALRRAARPGDAPPDVRPPL